ncbi:exopolysaccharide biosynthesis protein [Aquihabitans daechungensis]|uniref:exopolysaccharide biosynthesis protein n=1 Tax=Aquihabitans daechungensis TaxID=1052257 RepID=UPI003B9E9382
MPDPTDPTDPEPTGPTDPNHPTEPTHPGEPGTIGDRPGDFSDQLEDWLSSEGTKTLGDLGEVFAEKSFAVTVLMLMFLPALPLPTAGISDLFAAITVVVAAQLVLGREVLWLPARWKRRELGALTLDKAVPFIARRIRWFERFSRPRAVWVFRRRGPMRAVGLAIIACALGTILSPPFSGLDTLPAMGAVAIALGIILEDVVVFVVGTVLGAVGITLIVTLGAAAVKVVQGLF